MLSYSKLWLLLESKGMKKTDLKKIMSGNTLAKLSKNETISSDIIEKICGFLECQPGDIMEYVSEKQLEAMTTQLDAAAKQMLDALKAKGISEEQFAAMLIQEIPEYFKTLSNGGKPTTEALNKVQKEKEQ